MKLSPRAQDLLIATAVTVALAVELVTRPTLDGPLVANLAVYLPLGIALYWRRRRPLLVAAVLFACAAVAGVWLTGIAQLTSTMPAVLLAAYAGGRYAADLRPMYVLGVATVAVVCLAGGPSNPDNWIVGFTLYGGALFVGRALRNRSLVAAELAERTERLAVEHDLRAAEAAVEERRRIARELHDVVAHTLSVMVVQAGAARRTLERDADRAEEALATVETTGRAALGELRRMLGFVGDAPHGAHAPLEPQPTLGDLEALTRRAGAAGLPTTLSVTGEPGALPAGAEVALYRIAQEALTNAIKHSGAGAAAVVELRWAPRTLELEVRDDGGRGYARQALDALPVGGHGLIGMRERAGLFRGTLDAGPLPEGGFRVLAVLPREAAVVPA